MINAKNVVSREVTDANNNDTLPLIYTKVDDIEEDNEIVKDLLNTPIPEDTTISGQLDELFHPG